MTYPPEDLIWAFEVIHFLRRGRVQLQFKKGRVTILPVSCPRARYWFVDAMEKGRMGVFGPITKLRVP